MQLTESVNSFRRSSGNSFLPAVRRSRRPILEKFLTYLAANFLYLEIHNKFTIGKLRLLMNDFCDGSKLSKASFGDCSFVADSAVFFFFSECLVGSTLTQCSLISSNVEFRIQNRKRDLNSTVCALKVINQNDPRTPTLLASLLSLRICVNLNGQSIDIKSLSSYLDRPFPAKMSNRRAIDETNNGQIKPNLTKTKSLYSINVAGVPASSVNLSECQGDPRTNEECRLHYVFLTTPKQFQHR